MRAKRKEMFIRRIFFVLILFTFGLSAGGEGQTAFSLRIRNFEGANLLTLPIHTGEQFYIHYIHSSDKTPVRDTFQIDDAGQLVLVEEAFLWYGAGLEFQNHHGVQLAYDGKWSTVRLYRVFPELVIRVGRVAEQRLILKDQSIRFDRLARPGERIILSVNP
jgi:hypothetical protein